MTDVQRTKLVNVVSHALSGLSEQDYCCYEFPPVKQNPLTIRPTKLYDSDLVMLVEDLAEKCKNGITLPRVVMLLPTSKLDAYRNLLDQYGLTDQAHIVSRPESTEADIEEARTSTKPILISSPLFALGLNFDLHPEILICRFDHLQADTNQIIQTVNRANRGAVPCDTRIYGNVSHNAQFVLPEKTKLTKEVAVKLKQESTLAGLLEAHFQIDRNAYQCLRQLEKNTSTALSFLVKHDLFQNYRVVIEDNVPAIDKAQAAVLKGHRKDARQGYRAAIAEEAEKVAWYEIYLCFWRLEVLARERKEGWFREDKRVELEIKNEERGVVMQLCNLSQPAQAEKISVAKVKRLFGETSPWISAQYDRESFPNWVKVEAEKTEKLIVLVEKLKLLKAGTLPADSFAASLTRNRTLAESFLALCSNELEYLNLNTKFDTLAKARAEVRAKGSDKAKAKVRDDGLALLRELLEQLGVFFERSRNSKGKVIIDYTKPVIPANWDLCEMGNVLSRQAARLKALPVEQKVPFLFEDEFSFCEKLVPLSICESCVFIKQNACALGKTIDWQGGEWAGNLAESCPSFRQFNLK